MQVCLDRDCSSSSPTLLKYHSSATAVGLLKASTHPGQEVELEAESVEVLNGVNDVSDGEGFWPYPFVPRKRNTMEHKRDWPELRPKLNDFSAVLRVRSKLTHGDYHKKVDCTLSSS